MSTKTKNKSNFGGLSNDELLFIFFIIKAELNAYEEIISQKGISNRLTLPDGSFLESFKSLDKNAIQEIISSKKYTHLSTIFIKLEEISTLIYDTFPDLYGKIEDMFVNPDENKDVFL